MQSSVILSDTLDQCEVNLKFISSFKKLLLVISVDMDLHVVNIQENVHSWRWGECKSQPSNWHQHSSIDILPIQAPDPPVNTRDPQVETDCVSLWDVNKYFTYRLTMWPQIFLKGIWHKRFNNYLLTLSRISCRNSWLSELSQNCPI